MLTMFTEDTWESWLTKELIGFAQGMNIPLIVVAGVFESLWKRDMKWNNL